MEKFKVMAGMLFSFEGETEAANIKTTITTHVMINKSVPISTVSKLMGHSSPTITAKIYAHTKTETIATEVAKAFA